MQSHNIIANSAHAQYHDVHDIEIISSTKMVCVTKTQMLLLVTLHENSKRAPIKATPPIK